MEFNKFENQKNSDKPISNNVETISANGQESQPQGDKEKELSLEELHSLVDKLNLEIARKEPFLQQAEKGVEEIKMQIPEVDRSRENQLYQEFADQLGNFDQKIDHLKKLQKELSEEFTLNYDKVKQESLNDQVEKLAKTISKLEASKTNSGYDDKLFMGETKDLFPSLTAIGDRISAMADGKYNKYMAERVNNNQKQQLIDNNPDTVKLKENLIKLQKYKDEFEDELANLKIDRYNAVMKISKIEGSLE